MMMRPCFHWRWLEVPRQGPPTASGEAPDPAIVCCQDCDAWGVRPPWLVAEVEAQARSYTPSAEEIERADPRESQRSAPLESRAVTRQSPVISRS